MSSTLSSLKRVRVLVVDDHTVVRMGLVELLRDDPEMAIVGEAATVQRALEESARLVPDIVLLDIHLPDGSGVEACKRIKQQLPKVRVLILTSFMDDETILHAISAGADGYVLKEIDGPDLAMAIRKVAAGEVILDSKVARRVMEKARPAKNPLDALSVQERRVLALVAEGKTNKEVAEVLGLGEKTVRNYVSHLMEKLQISRRSEAAAWYVRSATPSRTDVPGRTSSNPG